MMDEGKPVWKIVLSICITLFLVVKLAYTCSKMSDANQQAMPIQSFDNDKLMNDYRKEQAESSQKTSNQILYKTYKQLDSIPDGQKKLYSVYKLRKDTVVDLDIETKIKITKESYFQKNYDDSLKMAFKSPDDIAVFIHDFTGKGTKEENFKSIKRGLNLESLKFLKGTTEKTNTCTYTITKEGTLYHGYAMGFSHNGYFLFLEFESDKVSKNDLKLKALNYLLGNLKSDK